MDEYQKTYYSLLTMRIKLTFCSIKPFWSISFFLFYRWGKIPAIILYAHVLWSLVHVWSQCRRSFQYWILHRFEDGEEGTDLSWLRSNPSENTQDEPKYKMEMPKRCLFSCVWSLEVLQLISRWSRHWNFRTKSTAPRSLNFEIPSLEPSMNSSNTILVPESCSKSPACTWPAFLMFFLVISSKFLFLPLHDCLKPP